MVNITRTAIVAENSEVFDNPFLVNQGEKSHYSRITAILAGAQVEVIQLLENGVVIIKWVRQPNDEITGYMECSKLSCYV